MDSGSENADPDDMAALRATDARMLFEAAGLSAAGARIGCAGPSTGVRSYLGKARPSSLTVASPQPVLRPHRSEEQLRDFDAKLVFKNPPIPVALRSEAALRRLLAAASVSSPRIAHVPRLPREDNVEGGSSAGCYLSELGATRSYPPTGSLSGCPLRVSGALGKMGWSPVSALSLSLPPRMDDPALT